MSKRWHFIGFNTTMNKYNPKNHNRRSIRLNGYDYSQRGLYFITICCQNRVCRFGQVVNGEMILNDAGKIADGCWTDIPIHFPNAVLHEHVVMPNHVHGIIELLDDKFYRINNDLDDGDVDDGDVDDGNVDDGDVDVGAENFLPLRRSHQSIRTHGIRTHGIRTHGIRTHGIRTHGIRTHEIIPRSISSIVKGYKIGVTKWFRSQAVTDTIWQRNFYESIIRDERAYQAISRYIINNPSKWGVDQFHKGLVLSEMR